MNACQYEQEGQIMIQFPTLPACVIGWLSSLAGFLLPSTLDLQSLPTSMHALQSENENEFPRKFISRALDKIVAICHLGRLFDVIWLRIQHEWRPRIWHEDETRSNGQIQAGGKTSCRFSSLLLYHCNQRGKFFLFRKDSTVLSMKKRLTVRRYWTWLLQRYGSLQHER